MDTTIKKTYWIPLLEVNKKTNRIIWKGKSLPLPLNSSVVGPLRKGKISEELKIFNLISDKKGLFCTIDKKTYLLGIENIFSIGKETQIINTTNSPNSTYINEEEIQNTIKTICNKKVTTDYYKSKDRGIQIKLSGRLGGANKSLKYAQTKGILNPISFDSKIDCYYKPIYTKWGCWGLKLYLGH